jgi:hypothetical protein
MSSTGSKFKDSQSRWRTLSLFWESRHPDYEPLYTLKEEAHQGLPSLYQFYLDSCVDDPTEYTFANTYLGGWSHWKSLKSSKWFKVHLKSWREELAVRRESKAVAQMELIRNTADEASPTRIQATKWLADRGVEAPKPKRGRPSKAEVKGNLKRDTAELSSIEEDAKNIGIH